MGLAFKAAIKAISPSLDALLSEFQTLLQKLNNLARNSCNLAHMIVDPAAKAIGDAIDGPGQIEQQIKGTLDDWTGSLKKFNAGVDSYLTDNSHADPKTGNGNVKSIIASGAADIMGPVGLANPDGSTEDSSNPNSMNNRVLVSMLGFEINGIPLCSTTNGSGTPTTADANPANGAANNKCDGVHTLDLDALIAGGGQGSSDPNRDFMLWHCDDPNGSPASDGDTIDPQICTKMSQQKVDYSGIRGYVNKMFFGDPTGETVTDDSIVAKFNSNASVQLSAAQLAFYRQSGVPFVSFFAKMPDPGNRKALAAMLGEHITYCMAGKIGEAVYRSIINIGATTNYTLTDDMKKRAAELRVDYKQKNDACTARKAVFDAAQEMIINTQVSANQGK